MIRAFELRGDHPGHWRLLATLRRRLEDAPEPPRPGYTPPAVRYRMARVPGWRELRVRDIDLPFLCQGDTDAAQRHLADILQARRGIRPAVSRLGRRFAAWLDQHRLDTEGGPLLENEWVVPCGASGSYTANHVSHKGSVLLDLVKRGYPVPDFSVLTAEVCPLPATERERWLDRCLENLERLTGRRLGDPERPLVLALRCAGPKYIPGFMPTYLNLGVTDPVVAWLERERGPEATLKTRCNQLKTLFRLLAPGEREDELERLSSLSSPIALARATDWLHQEVSEREPRLLEDALFQLRFCVRHAYDYFAEHRDLLLTFMRGREHYPALILQQMVCTVGGEQAYPGVLYSRNPRTGLGRDLEVVRDIFGEEIMTGTVLAQETAFSEPDAVRQGFPAVYHFLPRLPRLERRKQAPVTIEFAASTHHRCRFFALLQLNTTETTGRAALVAALGLYDEGVIPARRVLELVRPDHLHQVTSATIDDRSFETLAPFARGVSVLPRMAVTCRIYFSSQRALEAKQRGERVCLCKAGFGPEDTIVMSEVDAILSLTPAAIHVVTSCRGYGIPAFLDLERQGVRLLDDDSVVNHRGDLLHEGDWITLSSRRGQVYRGRAAFAPARFQRFLLGERLALSDGEAALYPRLKRAITQYRQLAESLQVDQLMDLDDLLRLVRGELRDDPRRASELVNAYYDASPASYLDEVLRSELGSHLEQSRVYDLLTPDRKASFQRMAVERCRERGLRGFTAGSFMLGRFLNLDHPVPFWRQLSPHEVGFLLNEWVQYQKYMAVLREVGERRVNRARDRILMQGLETIPIRAADVRVFTALKLAGADLAAARTGLPSSADPQASSVIELLEGPWSQLYDFDKPWSLRKLREICAREGVRLPRKDAQ